MFEVNRKEENGYYELIDGVRLKNLVHGEKTHMVKVILKKDKSLPLHSHPEEQTGYLLKGVMDLIIDGNLFRVNEGDSWSIKSNVPHEAHMIEDCEVIEIFSPPRKDYLNKSPFIE